MRFYTVLPFFLLSILLFTPLAEPFKAESLVGTKPFMGAQVFIEPGISAGRIDTLFMRMQENGMTMCRIRMFEAYMNYNGKWDFSLFDHAFDAAEKYGVKIYATFFPLTAKTDIGGWKFPVDQTQKEAFATYIKEVVNHYKNHPALYGWVLINEPGASSLAQQSEFIRTERQLWDRSHPAKEYKENGYPVLMDTRDQEFLTGLNTKFLQWIADEIKKYDTAHDVHVNNHAIFQNCAQYDFPAWRTFLTSLGGSAHASWHFSYFNRQQYALAMLVNAEIIRSGAGNLPWFMTELQGGNNTYSGNNAMCPTPEEITQWLWITLGCEGKGGIFWSLNPRSSGIEAGEWAMLTFQDQPSDRLRASSEVAAVIEKNAGVFSQMQVIPSGIDVIYIKESLWAEETMAIPNDPYPGRRPGAAIKSSAACFRALTERGLNVGFKEIKEYDFSAVDYTGKTIILSHQIAVPSYYKSQLEHFVRHGGTLFVEGLTAFFDEDLHNTMNTGFLFEKLFGGNISEFKITDRKTRNVQIGDHILPLDGWIGSISTGNKNSIPTLSENDYGKGRVIWLPSSVGLGAWESNDYKSLSDYLSSILPVSQEAFSFTSHTDNVIMRTLKTQQGTLLICINKNDVATQIGIRHRDKIKHIEILYNSEGGSFNHGQATLAPEGSLVVLLTH